MFRAAARAATRVASRPVIAQAARKVATEASGAAVVNGARVSPQTIAPVATTLAVPTWGVITTALGIALGAAKLGSDMHQGDKELTEKMHQGDKAVTEKVHQVEIEVVKIHGRLDRMDERLDRMDGRLDRVEKSLERIAVAVEAPRQGLAESVKPTVPKLK